MSSRRTMCLISVFLMAVVGACQTAQKPAPPPARPFADVAGLRILLRPAEPAAVAATGCPEPVIDSIPSRTSEAARSALSAAGFAVIDDESAAHALEARSDSTVTYCNPDVGLATGSSGLSLVRDGAVVHRSEAQGELSTQAAATSLFRDLVNSMLVEPRAIEAIAETRRAR